MEAWHKTFAISDRDARNDSLLAIQRRVMYERQEFVEFVLRTILPFDFDMSRAALVRQRDWPIGNEELWIDGRPVGRFAEKMADIEGLGLRWTFTFEEGVRHDGKAITRSNAAALEGTAQEGTSRAASPLA